MPRLLQVSLRNVQSRTELGKKWPKLVSPGHGEGDYAIPLRSHKRLGDDARGWRRRAIVVTQSLPVVRIQHRCWIDWHRTDRIHRNVSSPFGIRTWVRISYLIGTCVLKIREIGCTH